MIICLSTALYKKTTLARSFAYNINENHARVLYCSRPMRGLISDTSKMQNAYDQCTHTSFIRDFPALSCKRSTHPQAPPEKIRKRYRAEFDKKVMTSVLPPLDVVFLQNNNVTAE